MSTSGVSSKGQVTIPADVRKALEIQQGDDLVFELTRRRSVELRVIKRRKLSDLYGALPATRPFPGREEVRESLGDLFLKIFGSARGADLDLPPHEPHEPINLE